MYFSVNLEFLTKLINSVICWCVNYVHFKMHGARIKKKLLACWIISVDGKNIIIMQQLHVSAALPVGNLSKLCEHLQMVQLLFPCKFCEFILWNKLRLSLRSTGSEWVSGSQMPGSPRRRFRKRTECTWPWQVVHLMLSCFPSKRSCSA